MSGYRNNLFSVCVDAVGSVYVLSLGLVFTLILGGFFGVWIVEGVATNSSTLMALFWFGGVFVGMAQLWGMISYTLIAFEVIALFHVDTRRWLILLTLLLTQTCETSRMLLHYQDDSPWLHAAAMLGVIIMPILSVVAYQLLNREPKLEEAAYTDCRSCGYNLAGTLKDNRNECPECGHPVTDYQRIQANLDRHKQDGQVSL